MHWVWHHSFITQKFIKYPLDIKHHFQKRLFTNSTIVLLLQRNPYSRLSPLKMHLKDT